MLTMYYNGSTSKIGVRTVGYRKQNKVTNRILDNPKYNKVGTLN